MASYYKKIDGKDYDRAILDMAKASVEGQGDGRISLNDAKKIVKLIKDGGKITPVEKRSLQYVLKKFKFTDTASDHIKSALGKEAGVAEKKPVKAKAKPAAVSEKKTAAVKAKAPAAKKPETVKKVQPVENTEAPAAEKKSMLKNIIIILLLLLLIPAAYYLYNKYKGKTAEPVVKDAMLQSYSEISPAEQKKAEDVSAALKQKGGEDAGTVKKADGKTLYTIKENDTLVKISIEYYNDYRKWDLIWKHNRGVLKSPIMIFPGQVIELPDVKK